MTPSTRLATLVVGLAVIVALRAPSAPAAAAEPHAPIAPDTGRSTLDGVYTLAQANQGRDLFAGSCKECHSANVYSGQPLRDRWKGRTLGELLGYLRREMPKANPGSMSDDEYRLVIAYLLRLNAMPTGSKPLVGDSAALHAIRFADPGTAPSTLDTRQ